MTEIREGEESTPVMQKIDTQISQLVHSEEEIGERKDDELINNKVFTTPSKKFTRLDSGSKPCTFDNRKSVGNSFLFEESSIFNSRKVYGDSIKVYGDSIQGNSTFTMEISDFVKSSTSYDAEISMTEIKTDFASDNSIFFNCDKVEGEDEDPGDIDIIGEFKRLKITNSEDELVSENNHDAGYGCNHLSYYPASTDSGFSTPDDSYDKYIDDLSDIEDVGWDVDVKENYSVLDDLSGIEDGSWDFEVKESFI